MMPWHRNAEWKSVLYALVSGTEDVDRALFLRHLRQIRPCLDGHIRTMRMISAVKEGVAKNVIAQLNSGMRKALGMTEDFLTQPKDEEPHPFLELIRQTAAVRSACFCWLVFI